MSHAIPKTTLESLNEAVAGYNKIADPGDEISDEGVAEVRDISEDNATRQKRFFAEIGVLEKDGHDYYLTERGHELGRLIRFNQDEDAGELYKELLDDWEPTAEILAHIDEGGITGDDLSDKVALVTANELTTARKQRGAQTVVELLEWTGMIEEEDGAYYIPQDGETVQYDESETESESDPSPSSTALEQSKLPIESQTSQSTPNGGERELEIPVQTEGIDISLDISGSDDPENVEQILLSIRRGLEKDLDIHEDTPENEQ